MDAAFKWLSVESGSSACRGVQSARPPTSPFWGCDVGAVIEGLRPIDFTSFEGGWRSRGEYELSSAWLLSLPIHRQTRSQRRRNPPAVGARGGALRTIGGSGGCSQWGLLGISQDPSREFSARHRLKFAVPQHDVGSRAVRGEPKRVPRSRAALAAGRWRNVGSPRHGVPFKVKCTVENCKRKQSG